MSTGGKTVLIVVAGLAVVLIVLSFQKKAAAVGAGNTEGGSTAKSLFDFGAAVTNLAGKIIGPSNHPDDTSDSEEYTGPGGYDTSPYRVY